MAVKHRIRGLQYAVLAKYITAPKTGTTLLKGTRFLPATIHPIRWLGVDSCCNLKFSDPALLAYTSHLCITFRGIQEL